MKTVGALMLTLAGFLTVVTLASAPQPTPADSLIALRAAAVGCIRDNAAAVERNQPDLSTAAEFLIQYLCADEIRVYVKYEKSAEILADWRAGPASDASTEPAARTLAARRPVEAARAGRIAYFAGITIDPKTGEMIWPNGVTTPPPYPRAEGGYEEVIVTGQMFEPIIEELRAVAGRAVLSARMQRAKP